MISNGRVVAGSLKKTSETLYTAIIAPSSTGVVSVIVDKEKFEDLSGTLNPLPSNKVEVDYDPTSVKEITYDNHVNLYPNPAKNELIISIADFDGIMRVELFDMTGKQIVDKTMENNSSLNVSHLQSGIYIANITFGNHLVQKQIVIKK